MTDQSRRFLLFAHDRYYPAGGWFDLVGTYDSSAEAHEFGGSRTEDDVYIVDTLTGAVDNIKSNGLTPTELESIYGKLA